MMEPGDDYGIDEPVGPFTPLEPSAPLASLALPLSQEQISKQDKSEEIKSEEIKSGEVRSEKQESQPKNIKKRKKIPPMTKSARNTIMDFIKNVDHMDQWVNEIPNIDSDALFQSMAQILNHEFSHLPQEYIDSSKTLQNIVAMNQKITIFDVLGECDTIFRFAPAPSGQLHIGHVVPVLLNLLLHSISKKLNRRSSFVIRIDDTNPDDEDDDYTERIIDQLDTLIRSKTKQNYFIYRSSEMAQCIINIVESNILKGNDNFYVDLTDHETIGTERNNRTENKYRKMSIEEQINLLKTIKENNITNAVIRAKINMKSDNGNLRDPVMIRFVKNVMMPTYDLACPVLDSLDAISSGKSMIAMRDSNYIDRMEQYIWVQNALDLPSTALVTFSRVNFEATILKKRKIKSLIQSGKMSSWDDPRLMTIQGIFKRGMSLGGLLNFYWLSGHMSMENRATSQSISELFSLNDKILSQHTTFIVDRMPINFVPTSSSDNSWIQLIIYRVSQTSEYGVNDLIATDTLFAKKNRLITPNLKIMNDMVKELKSDISKELTKIMQDHSVTNLCDEKEIDKKISASLDTGDVMIEMMNLDKTKFKTCDKVMVGEIIKINNFKDLPDEPIFDGFYKVITKSDTQMDLIHVA